MRHSVVTLLLATVLFSGCFKQAKQPHVDGQVKGLLDDGIREFEGSGFQKGMEDPVSSKTLFEIGSITKVFTSILLADQVTRGKATLGDTVAMHLPADILPEDSPLWTITLLELATHTSGLPRLPTNLETGINPADPYAHYSEDQLYDYLILLTEDDLETPGKMSYSNLGVGLLGHLLEKISGKQYEELLTATILKPLQMKDTFVLRREEDIPPDLEDRLATGYDNGKPVSHWHFDSLCGAGAIVTTADDLLTFGEAHWLETTPDSLRKAMKLAATKQTESMGLGWFLVDGTLTHDGGTGGFRSNFVVSPQHKRVAVTLQNSSGPSLEQVSTGDFSPVSGYWQGNLDTGERKLSLFLRITNNATIVLHSINQGGAGITAGMSNFENNKLTSSFPSIGGEMEMELENGRLTGTWTQGKDIPLTLTRTETIPRALTKALKSAVPNDVTALDGYWSGYLGSRFGLFVTIEIDALGETADVRLYSPDQTEAAIPISKLVFDGTNFELESKLIKASYKARLEDSETIKGKWNQGVPLPLTLKWSAERPER